jgi:hypothetical protein
MRLREVDRTIEKRILTGLIVSKEYIQQVESWLKSDFFDSAGARKILTWCTEYYQNYQDAPSQHLMDLYLSQVKENALDEEETEYIERLLTGLSGEWEQKSRLNLNYLIDQTESFCRTKHLELVKQTLDGYLTQGRLEEAEDLVREFKPVSKTASTGFEPLLDEDGMKHAFESQLELIFKLPGAWGKMMNSQFYRGSFIGFLAPEKRGKSFLLQEIIMRALRAGRNVALFEAGDMTKDQRYCRIGQYVSQRPYSRVRNESGTMKVKIPLDFEGNFDIRTLPLLEWPDAIEACKVWMRRYRRGRFKMSVHENTSLTFVQMQSILERWERMDGFIPDLIVDDYIDIHAADNPRLEFRHQENDKWKRGRATSQRWHCCYITCTQADADSYEKENLSLKNFSEDKRKYAHVTAMYALNQTDDEKAKNILRVGELILREGGFDKRRQVEILQCLDIGRPYINSRTRGKHTSNEEES